MTEKLGDGADELKALRDRYVPRGITTAHPIVADRAQGSEVWDTSGKRYIDFVGGIGVMNVGHNHPRVMAAVREQLDRVTHTAFQVVMYESYLRLAERLCAAAPGDGEKKAIFFSTGAEAVENAVKIARAATGRPAVISFTGGFHGRTLLALSLTGTVNPYKQNFGPYAAEIYQTPFPYEYRGWSSKQALAALDELFESAVAPPRGAAIIIEPVLGEGGFVPAPLDFLRALRELTERHGILLIADEIQTGFGRTGKFFAIEHSGVMPDEHLPQRAARIGSVIEERMRTWEAEHELVGDVRVMGAMAGIELVRDRKTKTPADTETARILTVARERGLLLLRSGMHHNVIRTLMPLNIPDEQLMEGLDILGSALAEVAGVPARSARSSKR